MASLSPPTGPPPSRLDRAITGLAWLVSAEDRFLVVKPRLGALGSVLRVGQLAFLAARRYREDDGSDRAAALTFASLLSLLPVVLLSLSALGAVGFSAATIAAVRDWLLQNFLPETAHSLGTTVVAALDRLEHASKALGAGGLVALVLAVSKLRGALARTFRGIWADTGIRAHVERFAGFWLTVVLVPVLLVGSIYFITVISTVPGVGSGTTRALGTLSSGTALLLGYRFFPGRRARLIPAAVGAAVATLLWEGIGFGFAVYVRRTFLVNAVLAGLGLLPVALLWAYFSWVAFVYGAELAYVIQNPEEAMARSGLGDRAVPAGLATSTSSL